MGKAKDHVPALDGLRGLALAGVLAFHAGGALPGGYLGVDLFFVLSGFLITRLLLVEASDTRRIDLKRFWLRRARRLIPALLLLMPAVALYARFVAHPDEVHGIRWDALATLGYFANWREALSSASYWEIFTAPSPLHHTWSLAIEEQFYVVWPLVVLVCLRLAGRRGLAAVSIALAVASATAMLLLHSPERTSRVYFGTDTRATGILFGALFAMVAAAGGRDLGAWIGERARRAHITDSLGLWTKSCHPEWDRRFAERLGGWLASAGDLKQQLWIATVPYPLGRYDTPRYRAEVDCINRSVRTVAASQHLRVLELGDRLCPHGACRKAESGLELRPDGVHYDLEGARALGREVLERLEQGQPKG
jgi:hypothetical protein